MQNAQRDSRVKRLQGELKKKGCSQPTIEPRVCKSDCAGAGGWSLTENDQNVIVICATKSRPSDTGGILRHELMHVLQNCYADSFTSCLDRFTREWEANYVQGKDFATAILDAVWSMEKADPSCTLTREMLDTATVLYDELKSGR